MKRGIVALFALMTLVACGNNTNSKSSNSSSCSSETKSSEAGCCGAESECTQTKSSEVGCCGDKEKCAEAGVVEVLYMHGKQRCVTCVAIGDEAAALVEELSCDKVVLKTIDFSTPEGEKIADKYEIASSSLLVVKGGKVENLTAMSFKYAKNNPELFKQNLKETIQKIKE